ncbi:MAG: class II aldolase/adducin family protein [Spirochaetales bacterium]
MTLYDSCIKEREELASFMRRLYTQKLTTCSGGNLSMRLDDEHIIITPSSLDKGLISAEQIGLMKLDGENLTPHLKPSIESGMHIKIFQTRADVNAIVHAHPVTATSFSATEKQININLTAEAFVVLQHVVYASYELMGTDSLADIVAKSLQDSNVAIMKNHGVTTVANNLLSAFDKLEVLENAAIMTLNTHILQSLSPLHDDNIEQLCTWMGKPTQK